jgi:hypothetical protein
METEEIFLLTEAVVGVVGFVATGVRMLTGFPSPKRETAPLDGTHPVPR